MRFGIYVGVSFIVALTTVFHAWHTREEYFPTVVFMTTNKLAQVVIGNWVLVMGVVIGKALQMLFLGRLRDNEVEVVYDNARYAIMETCLALTVFRGDLSAVVFGMFAYLLIVKAYHWLAQARVEHLEQFNGPQGVASLLRLTSMVVLNILIDASMLLYCAGNVTLDEKPNVLILFAFEFAILSVAAISTLVHLVLHVIDTRMSGAWHGKSTCTMLLEFFSEVLTFSFYVIFFLVMLVFYGFLPVHLVRDMYVSFARVQRRLRTLVRYQRLVSTMEQRFPAATNDELAECEHTCIICRDAMRSGKKLPCSHIFHFHCLRLWLQQQQACPTCRADIPSHGLVASASTAERRNRRRIARNRPPAAIAQPPANPHGGDNDAVRGGNSPPAGVPRMGTTQPGRGFGSASRDGGVSRHPYGRNLIGEGLGPAGGGVSFGAFSHGIGGASSFASTGFASLLAGGVQRAKGDGVLPKGMMLSALLVVSQEGTVVRSGVNPNAAPSRIESCGSTMLLMAPPAPCGSFAVYGGWVGGPGRQGEVRLVDIAEPSFGQSTEDGPHSADDRQATRAEQAQDASNGASGVNGPVAAGGEAPRREGLRRRVFPGGRFGT
ncbi:unnamed protein product [Ascophyllum nodosum]